jgi:hypothetical protein
MGMKGGRNLLGGTRANYQAHPHPFEHEGPLVVEALEQSFALAQAVVTLASAHARFRKIADDPRAPEALRVACKQTMDAVARRRV